MSSLHSKTLFASFAVMAVVAAAFAGISVFGEDADAATDTGTELSPLSSVSGDALTYTNLDIYVKIGTRVNISMSSYEFDCSPSDSAASFLSSDSSDIKTNFGLSGTMDGSISGTISKTGTFKIYVFETGESESSPITFISVDVSSEPSIDFTSPAAVDSVSGSSIRYQAETNISGSTFKATGSGNATWLTLSSSGLLSGTAPGVSSMKSYTFSIQATSPGGQTAVQKVTFDVYPVAQLTATSLSINGTVGSAISAVTISSNIDCSLSIQNSSKLIDLGLKFDASTGKISGTPTKTGTATVKILGSTTEGPSQSPSIEISITISETSLKITSQPPTGVFAVGKNYTYNLTANQEVTWSISGNPSWLSLSGSKVTGQVSGVTEAGTITYSVTAKTSGGQEVSQQVSISVEPTFEFTSVPKASCSVTPVYDYNADGTYSLHIAKPIVVASASDGLCAPAMLSGVALYGAEDAIDYTAPDAVSAITGSKFTYNPATNITGTTFSKVSGADWLALSNGIVSGTAPSVAEKTDYQIVIRATSPYKQTIDQTVTITVYPIVKLTASALSTSVHEGSEMNAITVTSNVPVTWSKSGDLPAGVEFKNGKLSGTPTAQGSYAITIYGASVEGPSQTASIKVTIVVGEPVLKITSSFPTSMFLVGKQYNYTVTTNVPGCTFALGSDKPAWAVISGAVISGQISGYTDGTTIKFTVTATSAEKQTASQEISVTIEPVIAFTTVPTASCIVMAEYEYKDDGSFTQKTSGLMSASAHGGLCAPVMLSASAVLDDAVVVYDGESSEGGSSEAAPAPSIENTETRTFKFVWTGEDAERVTWDFGDGTTGEGFQVIHTYEKNGTYEYTCTGINSVGSSSVSGKIVVDVPDDTFDFYLLILIVVGLLIVIAIVVRSRKNKAVSGRRR